MDLLKFIIIVSFSVLTAAEGCHILPVEILDEIYLRGDDQNKDRKSSLAKDSPETKRDTLVRDYLNDTAEDIRERNGTNFSVGNLSESSEGISAGDMSETGEEVSYQKRPLVQFLWNNRENIANGLIISMCGVFIAHQFFHPEISITAQVLQEEIPKAIGSITEAIQSLLGFATSSAAGSEPYSGSFLEAIEDHFSMLCKIYQHLTNDHGPFAGLLGKEECVSVIVGDLNKYLVQLCRDDGRIIRQYWRIN